MKILVGDIFASKCQALVNPVNCVGAMGGGLALEFKKRFPKSFEKYVALCVGGEIRPGYAKIVWRENGKWIVCFPTRGHWRQRSSIDNIRRGFENLGMVDYMVLTSVAFPALGCGLGGLHWADVGPLMYRMLKDAPFDVEIYAPPGTPEEQLTEQWLEGCR